MKQNREESITKLLKKHPLHRSFIGIVLNELAEENIRTSIKQAFLGCSESELHELSDFAHGYVEVPPVIIPIVSDHFPTPIVPIKLEVKNELPTEKPVPNTNEGTNKHTGKKSSKRWSQTFWR